MPCRPRYRGSSCRSDEQPVLGGIVSTAPKNRSEGSGTSATPGPQPAPTFTVFTPTRNRRATLPRVYESLCRQTFRDFEWLIVDDGSTDGTDELVAAWQREGRLDLRYVWQEPGHKKTAFNRGVRLARGELFLSLDSDDACMPEALERLLHHWRSIPDDERDGFSAVTALCCDENGRVVGDRYPQDVLDANPMELRHVHRVTGEKWGFQRTDVLREFPFPEDVPGLVPEDVVWAPIGHRYRTRFVNEVLRTYHVPPPSAQEQVSRSVDFRSMAPGHVEWMLSILTWELPYFRHHPSSFLRAAAFLLRFALHQGRIGLRSLRRVPSVRAWGLVALAAPWGALLYCRDRLVMWKHRLHLRAP
jgi:glycosyltransferase involved in cell wall biosynthesis